MPDYTAIADIGASLVRVLWEEIQVDPQLVAIIDNENRISLQSPYDLRSDDSVRLSIYLYRICENPFTKNGALVQGTGGKLRKPPLTLDLFYLITPMVGSPREQQLVLGKVMQVLYGRSIVEGTDLQGSLAGLDQPLHVILNPLTLDEVSNVWQAMELSYRLSVGYTVRIAILDSKEEWSGVPVTRRDTNYGELA
jgi:hypothetical protein